MCDRGPDDRRVQKTGGRGQVIEELPLTCQQIAVFYP
jgi:hypothetical protein